MVAQAPGSPILTVPGWTGSGPGHWQSIWERDSPGFVRVQQRDWEEPDPEEWTAALESAVASAPEPPLIAAHSLGCLVVTRASRIAQGSVRGALLVAPPDVERHDTPPPLRSFVPVPLGRLRFPSILVASSNDPYLDLDRARALAAAWGSEILVIPNAGHINTASGYGPWPEGLDLLANLDTRAQAVKKTSKS